MLRGESNEGKQNVLEFRSAIWEERSLSLMLSFITIFFFFGYKQRRQRRKFNWSKVHKKREFTIYFYFSSLTFFLISRVII